ncbi:molybdopterin molybdotransferase MoeA [Curtobacterium sp. ISL-83]|uniref:molybdopterin molybdotransferase MoeA n=1 Tax=Curtobacterium sp. ISL-83 TaxID=2819145 RepID=UPI001BE76581|nr:molybdopterin-binding protein [Curtobacterium sp. ISL-83]MBT2502863.1 molybdopterin molybdenumtransferase MoeA [Curtobacterium sp. ISL-83]
MSADLLTARRVLHALGVSRALGPETVTLADAHGRTLAADVHARTSLPVADSSAMDGWVVAGAGPWHVDGVVRMGAPPGPPLPAGAARAITTGGAIPPGASAVVRLERAEILADVLHLLPAAPAPTDGTDIRHSGEEVHRGDRIASSGTHASPAVIAAAAASGTDEVTVVRRPRAALVLIGDEVITRGVPEAGQVRDTYGPVLPAILGSYGAETVMVSRVRDDPASVLEALSAEDVDIVISTGGTGGGTADHVINALISLHAEVVARSVPIRPGHPTVVAARPDGVPVIALPGNPFAALAALVALGLPVLTGMLGAPPERVLPRLAGEAIPGRPRTTRLVAVREQWDGVLPVGRQGAAMVSGLLHADALALIPEAGVAAGDRVGVLPLPWRR